MEEVIGGEIPPAERLLEFLMVTRRQVFSAPLVLTLMMKALASSSIIVGRITALSNLCMLLS